MRIESGVAKRALMRQGLIVAMLLAFACWFGWDGWVGYPQLNMEEAKKNFPVVPQAAVPQNSEVTDKSAKDFQTKIKEDTSRQLTMTDLERVWGKPAYLGAAEASASASSSGRAAFFVGNYGWAKVALARDTVSDIEWHDASKDFSSILVQKLLAAALVVGSMIPLGMLLGQMASKYVLDDEGLTVPKAGQIRYDQMTGIDLADLQKRGVVRLKYQDAKGQPQTAALYEDTIEKFDDIVLTLCEKKGWQQQLEDAAAQAEPPAGEDKNS